MEKDVVRPEENPIPLPVPTGTVMKVREGCQGPRIGGRRSARAHGGSAQGKRFLGPKIGGRRMS